LVVIYYISSSSARSSRNGGLNIQKLKIRSENDIFLATSYVRQMMKPLSFSQADEQKVIVTVLELTRNILDHAEGNGSFGCWTTEAALCIHVTDNGPGIGNLEEILNGKKDQASRGLGLGLLGAKRLMDEFHLESSKEGTNIIAKKWTNRKKFKR
jgi:serine/threonine-protein kinase RsbT